MAQRRSTNGVHPLWWTTALFATVLVIVLVCAAAFAGTFRRFVPVTVIAERSGLVMEPGAKVKLNGVEVGRVGGIGGGAQPVGLQLELYPDAAARIPANVEAQISSTTAFGAKYVDLIYPAEPSPQHISAGAVLRSRNVSTEVNTVFDNLVGLLNQIDVAKLNSVLTALGDALRGQGERMGQAITDSHEVITALNARMDTIVENWRSLRGLADTYAAAADDIVATMDASATTSQTLTAHESDLDALLLSAIGLANTGIEVLEPNKEKFVEAVNVLEPTTSLLLKYDSVYTCLLQGAKFALDNGGYENIGGNGKSVVQDVGLLFGDDMYRYPQHLPIVAAKGGPGGRPSCGSLPDVSKNFPVRYLVTNTGFGRGLDVRPNPGIGFPGWANYYPVTNPVPQPPGVFHLGGPAPGPEPAYPGAPPYGAQLYAPDGTPLWPGIPDKRVQPAPAPEAAPADGTPHGPASEPLPAEAPPPAEPSTEPVPTETGEVTP